MGFFMGAPRFGNGIAYIMYAYARAQTHCGTIFQIFVKERAGNFQEGSRTFLGHRNTME
jgi:hypothetical protein